MTAPCREDLGVARWSSAICPVCSRRIRRRLDDSLHQHNTRAKWGSRCSGSGSKPMVTVVPAGEAL